MDRDKIEQLLYKQMYAYKYMLESKRYDFNSYVKTVSAEAGKEIKEKIEEDDV